MVFHLLVLFLLAPLGAIFIHMFFLFPIFDVRTWPPLTFTPDFSVYSLIEVAFPPSWPAYNLQQKILTALWGITAIFIMINQEVSITLNQTVPSPQGFLWGSRGIP